MSTPGGVCGGLGEDEGIMPRTNLLLAACLAAFLSAALAMGAPTYAGGERTSYALNDYTRLGQTFTTDTPFDILTVSAPSWSDNEGGYTISVYDSPRREKLLARKAYSNFVDNAELTLYVIPAAPAGTHYWEISNRTGKTKVGLYAYRNSTYAGGCAYFDGVANEKVDFVSSWRYTPYVGTLRRLSLTERAQAASGSDKGLPQWLWYPEPRIPSNCTRYFRFTFDLPTAARTADLLITADDSDQVWANGKSLGGGGWDHPRHFAIAALLHQGRNVIAAQDNNAVAPAGLIALLKVTLADGRKIRLISDTSKRWRSWNKLVKGWTAPDFDDSSWKPCVSVGDALSDPWFPHGTVSQFAADYFNMKTVLDKLRGEPPMHAQIKYEKGAVRLIVNGKPVAPFLFASVDLSDFAPDFGAYGMHMYQPRYNLSDVWVAPGKYDFKGWDLHLARLLYGDPKATFLIMMYLQPPKWWLDAHKDQLVQYADGTGAVSDQWGGSVHASYASQLWLHDATAAFRAVIAHFEHSPLRSRILGYHIANGIYGEWHYFDAVHMPDTGKPFVDAFRHWAESFYHTAGALSRAWGRKISSPADITAPTVYDRTHLDCDLLRDPARSTFVSDYYRFLANVSADTVMHFAHVVKQATGGRVLCGSFYCYLMENLWIQEGGHLEGPRVLEECPDLDYVSNPYSYQTDVHDDAGNDLGSARGVGGDGAYRVPVASVRLHKKFYFSETDTCSWLEFDPTLTPYGGEGTDTPHGTVLAIRRDFAQALGEGVGTWMLELGPGWWANKNLMSEIRRLRGLLQQGTTRDLTPVAQIAAVCQPETFFYSSHWTDPEAGDFDIFDAYYLDAMNRALHRVGAPVDFLYVQDIDRCRDYKIYLFLNDFYLTDQQIAAINAKVRRKGAVAVWVYAPGFVAPRYLSAERMSSLIGMRVARMNNPGSMIIDVTDRTNSLTRGAEKRFGLKRPHSPRFAVVDPAATKLGNWEGTERCAFAVRKMRGWTSVYVGGAPIPIGLLRNLAAAAGVHFYSSKPDIVYANKSYLCLIANGAGKRTVHLVEPMREVLPEAGPVRKGDVTLDLAEGDVVIWEKAGR